MDIKDIVKNLTLEEKSQLVGGADAWNTVAVKRIGIPAVRVSDGPHGLRKTEYLEDGDQTVQAVCFPSGAGLASSFNCDMMNRLGSILGKECKAENVNVILGPAINIKRSPLCGRNFEYLSEDPYLAGRMASAYVKGVQAEGVGVSLKHFAANNQEKRRMTVSAVIDERTLREIYLSAFEEVVKTSKPDTLMCSYNKINGVYSSENPWLLNEVLRSEWGFEGLVMSDWGAVCDRPKGVAAGLDLEMPSSNGINAQKVKEAVIDGSLDEKLLDIAVENVLKLVDKYTGFAKNVTGELWDKEEPAPEAAAEETGVQEERQSFDRVEDHKEARRIARESMVLLKNEGALPVNKDQKILFVGEFARKPRIQGGGSSHINCTRIISAMEASTRHTKVEYAKGFSSTEDKIDDKLADEAVEKAREADVVIVFAGLPDSFESEGYDRKHMRLPQCQNRLIRAISDVQPNTVVVLHNGSPVSMPWIDNVNAVLEAYLGGEASGEAVIDILFGVVNPSGKLAETFPVGIKDTPCYNYFPGNRLTVEYREGLFVGYRYYDKVGAEVLFPFGHGLSYTTFTYGDLKVNSEINKVKVKFRVKNTGSVAGAETAQVYISKLESKILRAPKELKGFEKVKLAPGEEKEITLELDERAFSYYSVSKKKWIVEPGKYAVLVGASSRDIRLKDTVSFDIADETGEEFTAEELPSYFAGTPACVPDDEFSKLIGGEIPASQRPEGEKFNIDLTLEDIKNTGWGGQLYVPLLSLMCGRRLTRREAMEEEGMSEMPLHSAICMSGGRFSPETGKQIVDLINKENVGENLKALSKIGLKAVGNSIGNTGNKAISKTKDVASDIAKAGRNIVDKLVRKDEDNEPVQDDDPEAVDSPFDDAEIVDVLVKEKSYKTDATESENDNGEDGADNMDDETKKGFDAERIGEKLGEAGAKIGQLGKGLIDKLEESGIKEKLETAGLKIGDKIDELQLDKKIEKAVNKIAGKAEEVEEGIRRGFSEKKDEDGDQ